MYLWGNGARLKHFQCQYCGKEWVKLSTANKFAFCSLRCSTAAAKRHRKDVKRARRFGGGDPDRVPIGVLVKRDRGICFHCKKSVDTSQSVPHPLAPTRDHYVPLSKGGHHTWDNIVLSHFSCNVVKNNTVLRVMGRNHQAEFLFGDE